MGFLIGFNFRGTIYCDALRFIRGWCGDDVKHVGIWHALHASEPHRTARRQRGDSSCRGKK